MQNNSRGNVWLQHPSGRAPSSTYRKHITVSTETQHCSSNVQRQNATKHVHVTIHQSKVTSSSHVCRPFNQIPLEACHSGDSWYISTAILPCMSIDPKGRMKIVSNTVEHLFCSFKMSRVSTGCDKKGCYRDG